MCRDGLHGTHLVDGPCARTQAATHPWWAVDLVARLYVAGVKFTNRDDWGTYNTIQHKKLSYRRGTARCVVSIEILPIATQQCRNFLYDKS